METTSAAHSTKRRRVQPPSIGNIAEEPGNHHESRSSAQDELDVEAPVMDQPPEDSGDVSVTNSEVESAMNHRRRKEALRHQAFSEQEFNSLSSVDAYIGAARDGLEGAAKLISSSLEVSRQQNEKLDEELEVSRTQVETMKAELEQVKNFTREAHVAESIGQLQKDLDASRQSQRYVEIQQEAGHRVLTRSLEEMNRLKAENQQQAEELESLKTQLAQAQEENQRLQRGMFCLLTRRPEEEIGSFRGSFLKELSVVHERARRAMKSMAKALWPAETPPEGMSELADRFKGDRCRFELWKTSACQEGAREVWAMVKTRFTKLNPEHMARVGPVGPDGQEVPLHLVDDQVMPAARLSQEDCTLDTLINNLDKQPGV